jgi:chorismate mutase
MKQGSTNTDKLKELRSRIDQLDEDLLDLLAKRIEIVKEIGKLKKDYSIKISQVKRWREIIKDRLSKGKSLGLNEEFLMNLLQEIHKEAIKRQNEIMNQNSEADLPE